MIRAVGKRRIGRIVPLLLFVASFLLAVFVTYQTTAVTLDGDASSELVLSHHLYETGQIISRDWYYSTELRVLNTQLVFAPLFGLTDDWRLVRVIGTVILQVLLVLSYGYFCKAARLPLNAWFLGGALLLLPTSVAYGRIVLYYPYYIPHIALSFLLIAMFLNVTDGGEGQTKGWFVFHLAGLLVLSFLCGTGGMRHAGETFAPLFLALLFSLLPRLKILSGKLLLRAAHPFFVLTICLLFFLGGYAVNRRLSEIYSFKNYSAMVLGWYPAHFGELVFAILHTMGMRRDIPAVSLNGVFSAAAVFLGMAMAVHSVRVLFGLQKEKEAPLHTALLQSLYPAAMLTIIAETMFLKEINMPIRYILPFSVWLLIWLVQAVYRRKENVLEKKHPLKWLAAVCAVAVFLGNGFLNACYFENPEKNPQPFEGLSWKRADTVARVEAFLDEVWSWDSYELGYSTIWLANLMTELTNGELPAIMIDISANGDVHYRNWLSLDRYREIEPEKSFIMVSSSDLKNFKKGTFYKKHCELIYEDDSGMFTVYSIDDPEYARSALRLPQEE